MGSTQEAISELTQEAISELLMGGFERRGRSRILPAWADIQPPREQGGGPAGIPAHDGARTEAARARSRRRGGLERPHAERYSLSACLEYRS